MVTFDTSELRELSADLGEAKNRVGAGVSKAIRTRAKETQSSARRHAPRRTGALAESIGVDFYGDGRSGGMTAVIGPSIRYGIFQERGTSKMAAHPFMAPAFDEVSPKLQDDIAKAVEDLL